MKCGEESRTCDLCGYEGYTVCSSLACYADDGRFERIDRCVNHNDCRRRVEEDGREWELIDITEKWVKVR